MGITLSNNNQGGRITIRSSNLGGRTTTNAITIIPLLLNTYSGSAVAFSLRRLDSSYSGNAIRVRRSNDNAEQDIGFVNNQLDTASLSSFVSSNSAFITRWYDQSGNNVTASQATAANQPRIVNAGTIDSQGGKPSMWFIPNSISSLVTTTAVSTGTYMSTFLVTKMDETVSAYKYIVTIGTYAPNTDFYSIVLRANSNFYDWVDGDAIVWGSGASIGFNPRLISNGPVYNNIYALTSVFAGSTNTSYYVNNSAVATRVLGQGNVGTNTINALIIGSRGAGEVYDGYLSELIIYRSNQFSNRAGIESNINSNYTIY
jgi:hypothetical protein